MNDYTHLNIEAERAAFEAWHRSKFETKYSTGQPTRDMHNGIYAENYGPKHQQQMWEAWLAARRALTADATIKESLQVTAQQPAGAAAELPPTLPRSLLDLIGEYGMARTDGLTEMERLEKWDALIGGIKRYASEFAADHRQRKEAAQEKS